MAQEKPRKEDNITIMASEEQHLEWIKKQEELLHEIDAKQNEMEAVIKLFLKKCLSKSNMLSITIIFDKTKIKNIQEVKDFILDIFEDPKMDRSCTSVRGPFWAKIVFKEYYHEEEEYGDYGYIFDD